MTVVAAFDGHRQPDAQLPEQIGSPGTKRDHALTGIEEALVRFDAPSCAATMQRPRIALQKNAAKLAKMCRVGPRHGERIADARRLGPEHRVRKHAIERWLERQCTRGIKRLQRKPKLGGNLHLGR